MTPEQAQIAWTVVVQPALEVRMLHARPKLKSFEAALALNYCREAVIEDFPTAIAADELRITALLALPATWGGYKR
jgi:hypothetical protein